MRTDAEHLAFYTPLECALMRKEKIRRPKTEVMQTPTEHRRLPSSNQDIIHQRPPITHMTTNAVNIPAPALSFVPSGDFGRTGSVVIPPPAAGLPLLVPPVLLVNGAAT